MSKQLRFEDIANAEDTATEVVEVPEWGGHVVVQSMTGAAKDQYEQSLFEKNNKGEFERDLGNVRAKLIASCVIGPDGKLMFSSPDQVKLLGSKSAKALDRVFEVCQRLNAVTEKDIEELQGN